MLFFCHAPEKWRYGTPYSKKCVGGGGEYAYAPRNPESYAYVSVPSDWYAVLSCTSAVSSVNCFASVPAHNDAFCCP